MPTPANSINEATTGIVGFTGTSFTATPVTQFDVLIGGATSSAIVNVTNGTTGQFLGANTGAAPTWMTPAGTVTSVVTTNATPQFSLAAGVETINFAITNLCFGSSLPSLAGGTQNTSLGQTNLNILTSGSFNTCIGNSTGTHISTGTTNTFVGALIGANSNGSGNCVFGENSFTVITSGSNNIVIGSQAGNQYAGAESNNILISSPGVGAESNVIHIGTQGSGTNQQNKCFIAGISGVTAANPSITTINTSTGQLGNDTTNFTILSTGLQLKGNNANTSPPAGTIGEQIRATVARGSAVSISNNTGTNITSIVLTAGTWDISGVLAIIGSLTGTAFIASINNVSATVGNPGDNDVGTPYMPTAASDNTLTIPSWRLTTPGTTVYLIAFVSFTVGTCTGYGRISATRVG